MTEQNEGFTEDVVVEDLSDVKEEKQLVPAARGVKLLIKKAEIKVYKDGAYKVINLQLQLVDGIDMEGGYKNKVVFGMVCFYADPVQYTKDFFTKKQHLVQLKHLLSALSVDLATIKINQEFLTGITNQMVLADITQTKGNDEYGPSNEVKNYKEVPQESMV